MSSLFIYFLWLGGMQPVWQRLRKKGYGKIASAVSCVTWPIELGTRLAKKYCKEPFE